MPTIDDLRKYLDDQLLQMNLNQKSAESVVSHNTSHSYNTSAPKSNYSYNTSAPKSNYSYNTSAPKSNYSYNTSAPKSNYSYNTSAPKSKSKPSNPKCLACDNTAQVGDYNLLIVLGPWWEFAWDCLVFCAVFSFWGVDIWVESRTL